MPRLPGQGALEVARPAPTSRVLRWRPPINLTKTARQAQCLLPGWRLIPPPCHCAGGNGGCGNPHTLEEAVTVPQTPSVPKPEENTPSPDTVARSASEMLKGL